MFAINLGDLAQKGKNDVEENPARNWNVKVPIRRKNEKINPYVNVLVYRGDEKPTTKVTSLGGESIRYVTCL